ncbi:MAG: hypothetical protein KIT87_13935 [Anaerolineae bacterium]|nr:hypothetical protein [Anaerolineae bacterium]
MQGELVATTTADGQTLHGCLVAPSSPRLAVLALHDLYGNFYALPDLADLAAGLANAGGALLAANTRDHDGVASLSTATLQFPDANQSPPELLDAAGLDIAAWLGFLQAHGLTRILLLGQGLGACKVAAYTESQADQRLAGLALLSPPDHAALVSQLGQRLDEALAWALLMLEAGQADELIRLEGIGPLSARTIRDLFGLRGVFNRFDYADRAHDWGWLARIRVPLLVLHTEADRLSRPAPDALALIARHATAAPSVATHVVSAEAMATTIVEWVRAI